MVVIHPNQNLPLKFGKHAFANIYPSKILPLAAQDTYCLVNKAGYISYRGPKLCSIPYNNTCTSTVIGCSISATYNDKSGQDCYVSSATPPSHTWFLQLYTTTTARAMTLAAIAHTRLIQTSLIVGVSRNKVNSKALVLPFSNILAFFCNKNFI